MTKKHKQQSGNPSKKHLKIWTEFVQVQPNFTEEFFRTGGEIAQREASLYLDGTVKMYQNNLYVVHVRALEKGNMDGVIHLSIRRQDRNPIRDWAHLQAIKNVFGGVNREAIEIFPSQERLVDMANQYHLWVMPTGEVIPFGFRVGREMVGNSEDAESFGAKQREKDFEEKGIEVPTPKSDTTLISAQLTADAQITKAPQVDGEVNG